MQVRTNNHSFDYDVHSLVKAFYPLEDVKLTDLDATIEEDNCIDFTLPMDVDAKSRPEVKSSIKRDIYKILSERTGITLPWGTLTGIRPCKIPMKMIEEWEQTRVNINSKSYVNGDILSKQKDLRNDIYSHMKETYLVSDEKIALATDIAFREKNILKQISGVNGYSLYIGIPFCPTRCLYCSFTSYPIATYEKKGIVRRYIEALKEEIDYVACDFAGRCLDSVYIGGGTPTSISADDLREIIRYVKSHLDVSHVRELTVEAGRPDSITRDKLMMLKEEGVTRISINPQTMNEKTLKIIGRQHTVEQLIDAFKLARECGHDNINMDIILGLPGEGCEEVSNTLKKIKSLKPDSLTVHSMAIKRAAGMHDYLTEHPELESINTPEIMTLAARAAQEMGMKPYYLYRQKNMSGNFENTGYAIPGKEGIYNIAIMEEVQSIVACGAGTVTKNVIPQSADIKMIAGDGGNRSKLCQPEQGLETTDSFTNVRIERCDDVKDIGLYIEKIDEMIERKRRLFSEG